MLTALQELYRGLTGAQNLSNTRSPWLYSRSIILPWSVTITYPLFTYRSTDKHIYSYLHPLARMPSNPSSEAPKKRVTANGYRFRAKLLRLGRVQSPAVSVMWGTRWAGSSPAWFCRNQMAYISRCGWQGEIVRYTACFPDNFSFYLEAVLCSSMIQLALCMYIHPALPPFNLT